MAGTTCSTEIVLFISLCLFAISVEAQQGLRWKFYNNSGFSGDPLRDVILRSFGTAEVVDDSFSGELTGTVQFPTDGAIVITCSFSNTTSAFVWIDDHLVCQDENVYHPPPGSTDNPIFVSQNRSYTIRAQVYFKAAQDCVPVASFGCFNDSQHECAFKQTYQGSSLTPSFCAAKCNNIGSFIAAVEDGDQCFCGSTLKACGPLVPDTMCNKSCTGEPSLPCGASWLLHAFNYSCTSIPGPTSVSFEVLWSLFNTTSPAPFPTKWLSPTLPTAESERISLQKGMAVGWGLWVHSTIMSIAHLPDAATLDIAICDTKSNACLDGTKIEGPAKVRVGPHAYNRSYIQFFVDGSRMGVRANFSIEFSGGDDVVAMVSGVGGSAWPGYYVRFTPRFAWLRAGFVEVGASELVLSPHGESTITLSPTQTGQVQGHSLIIPLSNGPVAISSRAQSLEAITAMLARARAVELATYAAYGALADVKEAVQAAVMWNLIYTPAEQGFILPVR